MLNRRFQLDPGRVYTSMKEIIEKPKYANINSIKEEAKGRTPLRTLKKPAGFWRSL